MLKNITRLGFRLAESQEQDDVEMNDDSQQQPPQPPPPAREMQCNSQQLEVLQDTYEKLVSIGGPDSKAALEIKRALEHQSNRLTPVAMAKNSLTLTQELHAWEKSKATLIIQHQHLKDAAQKEMDTLRSILDAKEKELQQMEQ
eukprot:11456412-Karenia_brevis.AAC.1